MNRPDLMPFRWDGCLEAQLVDLQICRELDIPHPDYTLLEKKLIDVGGVGKAVCDHCVTSCVLRLTLSTGVELVSPRQDVTENCIIRQEVQDPTF